MSLLVLEDDLAREKFHRAPFRLRHQLAGHELFTLPRLRVLDLGRLYGNRHTPAGFAGLRATQLRQLAVGQGKEWRLFAGAGIVAGSDPSREWAETRIKFQPVLKALSGARAEPSSEEEESPDS